MTNLYALDPATGKEIWVNTDAVSTYGTPAAFKLGDVDLIITPRGHAVRADTGKIVAEDIAHSGTPSPITGDGTNLLRRRIGERRSAECRLQGPGIVERDDPG